MTRVTSCIKETGTLDKYCGALVSLLESCLHHNLMPLGHLRDDDPPHAKIASDIIACIVLVRLWKSEINLSREIVLFIEMRDSIHNGHNKTQVLQKKNLHNMMLQFRQSY